MSKSYVTEDIEPIVNALVLGKPVGLPTETVYGLGANACRKDAVKEIFLLKQRPLSNPLILHFASFSRILPFVKVTKIQQQLLEHLAAHLWPGPLTVVLPASNRVDGMVTAQTGWVGCRVPRHPQALRVLERLEFPVAAPSANVSGHISPTTAYHVLSEFPHAALPILNGGACEVGLESTVVKLNETGALKILRPGFYGAKELQSVCPQAPLVQKEEPGVDAHPVAPGQSLLHYSPRCVCYLVEPKASNLNTLTRHQNISLVDWDGYFSNIKGYFDHYVNLDAQKFPVEAAHSFFDILRECELRCQDHKNKNLLLTIPPAMPHPLHGALFDRMYRAAAGKIWQRDFI